MLKLLQESVGPMSVAEISEEIGIHKNSARFHLDSLAENGYVTREKLLTGETGRPRLVYRATSESPNVSPEHLTNLCQILIRNFITDAPQGDELAEQAGYEWGCEHACPQDDQQILTSLAQMLAEQGFAPTIERERIWFDHCPYRAARLQGEDLLAVCALHKGIVKGYLESSGSSLTTGDLTVGGTCKLNLVPSGDEENGTSWAPAGDGHGGPHRIEVTLSPRSARLGS